VLLIDGDPFVAEAFIRSRLAERHAAQYGTMPTGTDVDQLLP